MESALNMRKHEMGNYHRRGKLSLLEGTTGIWLIGALLIFDGRRHHPLLIHWKLDSKLLGANIFQISLKPPLVTHLISFTSFWIGY